MRGRIVLAEVGFRFHDAGDEGLATLASDQEFAEQLPGDAAGIAIKEFRGQRDVGMGARGHSVPGASLVS
jgi:hypothetical protein